MAKVIVITGAGAGLGRALARRFATEGERVVLLGRTWAKVQAAAADIGEQATAICCDVASPASVRAAFAEIAERHARVDVLINNAAVFEPFLIEEASDEQILNALGANLAGPMFCARSAIPLMPRGGHIINVSSDSVELPFPHLIAYASSKAGLERFSLGLHRELEPHGIRVTIVRAAAISEEGKTWDIDPAAGARFAQAAAAAGLDLRTRPISEITSVTQVFRALIDLPDDLHAVSVALLPRAP